MRYIAAAALAMLLAGFGTPSEAQQMFKCGANYQDRPCADQEVQKRYSGGRFDVDQVNKDTDRDCARVAADAMPYWSRLKKGESMASIQAEYDAKPVAREEKSTMREVLITLNSLQSGSAAEARGELERRCMAFKQRKGLPTERETETARARNARNEAYEARRRAQEDQQRVRALCMQNYGRYNC
jgi:hypothetical protein